MALQIHTTSSLFRKSYRQFHLLSPSKPNLRIQSQNPTTDAEPANQSPAPKKSTAPGLGFGSSSSSPSSSTNSSLSDATSSSTASNKKKPNGKRDRASIIRRSPVQKPATVSQQEEAKATDQNTSESAFIVAWLGLGGIILVQGLLLSASGFLPDEWDKLFVKYLYPSFTPTVFLFVAGSVTYGVLKYLQNENLKDQK
ncbi:protein LPA2 [Euphorbia lathyris]|uniref:protein LPA2 n=1 Tax=Euphorbia lathyris TaxID=212925 RepID=UPI0033135EA1